MIDLSYPVREDGDFNIKIASKEEFKLAGTGATVSSEEELETISDKICNIKFTLKPHQLFVRNFLSLQTPYNTLLLYHGLGTGKTCSAITIAEEMRQYMMQRGVVNRIIIVASTNVQANFKKQLYDKNNIDMLGKNMNIASCVGNEILAEVNPGNKITDVKVVSNIIEAMISKYYKFMGYQKFSKKISKMSDSEIKQKFEDRLVIIDEVHNIRTQHMEKASRAKSSSTEMLDRLVATSHGMRLLLLSATPMYNSYKEIIWLLNIINMNDKRPTVNSADIFTQDGEFILDDAGNEVGKARLIALSRGYISFVRGENPYSFPYRVYPQQFNQVRSLIKSGYKPAVQYNNIAIIDNIKYLDIYLTKIHGIQKKIYNALTNAYMRDTGAVDNNIRNNAIDMHADIAGYSLLMTYLQTLNIVYPLDKYMVMGEEAVTPDYISNIMAIEELVGKSGFERMMVDANTFPYTYKPEFLINNKSIFNMDNLQTYGNKMHTLITNAKKNKGISMIYSQYLYSGLMPIVCALEELGYTNANKSINFVNAGYKKSIKVAKQKESYIIITGNPNMSPNVAEEVSAAVSDANLNGEIIKFVLISRSGSEGIDFKNIRSVHILDPWFNMNRNEQIIGRAVRNCSHKKLPFNKRNVAIYLYGTNLESNVEAIDMYLYRISEKKSIQIGKISRVLKETSVDCLLQDEQANMTIDDFNLEVTQSLATAKTIKYKIGDTPYTYTCDYMDSCKYKCMACDSSGTQIKQIDKSDITSDDSTLHQNHLTLNINILKNKIKDLYGIGGYKLVYSTHELHQLINFNNQYTNIQFSVALEQLTDPQRHELVVNRYGNTGSIIHIDDLYIYQPIYTKNKSITMEERGSPIHIKRETLNMITTVPKADSEFTYDIDSVCDIIKSLMSDVKQQINEQYYKKIKELVLILIEGFHDDGQTISKNEHAILIGHFIEQLPRSSLVQLYIYYNTETTHPSCKGEFPYTESNRNSILDTIRQHITDNTLIIEPGNVCFIVPKHEEVGYDIIINYDTQSSDSVWKIGNKYDISQIESKLSGKYNVSKSNIMSIIGFKNIQTPKDKRFNSSGIKLKRMTGKTMKGRSCVSYNKADIDEYIVGMLYDNIKYQLGADIVTMNHIKDAYNNEIMNYHVNKQHQCFIVEFMLRLFDIIFEKRQFLTLSEALYCADASILNLI